MTITPKTIAFAILASAIIFFLWALVASQQASTVQNVPSPMQKNSSLTQELSEGNVTINVTPRVLMPNEKPVFEVKFDTHSVNLDFDVATITTLEDNNGSMLGIPTWDGDPSGSHHRSGSLSFSQPLTPAIQQVTVTFHDIAGIPKRPFTWEVKPQ